MKLYSLAVLALATLGCESHPKVKWAPGEAPGAPSTPVGVTFTPDHESVTVRWTANPTDELVSSYLVYSAAEPWQTWNSSLTGAAQTGRSTRLAKLETTSGRLERRAAVPGE